jgi:hypothetical protein
MLWAINDVHHKVIAISTTKDGKRVVCGRLEGQVQVWTLRRESQTLPATLREQRDVGE